MLARLEPKWQQAQVLEAPNGIQNSLQVQSETFITGFGFCYIQPAPQPRDRDWGRGAEIVMATIFGFICFLQQFQGSHSQLGCQPTRPPELKQVAGKHNTSLQF